MDNLDDITELLSFLHSWFDAFFGRIPWEKQPYSTSSIIGNIFSLGQFQVEYKRSNKVIHRRVVLGMICLVLIPILAINKGIWLFFAFLAGLMGIYQIYQAWNPYAIRCVAVFNGGIAWKKRKKIHHLSWHQISHAALIKDSFGVFTREGNQIYFEKALYDSEFGQSIAIALQKLEEEQL